MHSYWLHLELTIGPKISKWKQYIDKSERGKAKASANADVGDPEEEEFKF